MATDKRKRAIRALADKRGISYTAAMRMHDANQEQKPRLLQPASTDYHLGTVGLDLNRPMLMVGGGASGKTTIAATIAAQALERGMQVEFLSQGESGLETVADALTPEEAMDRAEALSEELFRRARLYIHARKDAHAAYVSENPGLREKDIALDHHSVMNEGGIPPLLVVDDDMPKAIRTRSERKRYLSTLAEVTKRGRDYGIFLLSTRSDPLDAFAPEGLMEQLGDVLFLGSEQKMPHSPTLISTLKARGLDTHGMFMEMGPEGYGQVGTGIMTYDDYYEVVNLFPPRTESPIWDGEVDPDPLTFTLGNSTKEGGAPVTFRAQSTTVLGESGTGKTTLMEQIAAQALLKPMPWDENLRATVHLIDPTGEGEIDRPWKPSRHWQERGAVSSSTPESIHERTAQIEREHRRRLTLLSEHDVGDWEALPDAVKVTEGLAPILVFLDHGDDLLDVRNEHASTQVKESMHLLQAWAREGRSTGIIVLTATTSLYADGAPVRTNPLYIVTGGAYGLNSYRQAYGKVALHPYMESASTSQFGAWVGGLREDPTPFLPLVFGGERHDRALNRHVPRMTE